MFGDSFGFWAKTVSEAQDRAEEAKREAVAASEKAIENEQRAAVAIVAANAAKEEADKSRAERENVTYEFRPLQPSIALMDLESELSPPSRGRMLAGILVGASLMLGALGFYVMKPEKK